MKENTNEVDRQYREILNRILEKGHKNLGERTGVGTLSLFGEQMRFKMSDGLPVLTTKEVYLKGVICELLWFLGNHTRSPEYKDYPIDNIKYMLDNNVNIWVGDLYKNFINYINNPENEDEVLKWLISDGSKLREMNEKQFISALKNNREFSLKFGGIGAGYGWQWNHFGGDYYTYKRSFSKLGGTLYSGINQIQGLIKGLKENPQGRRHLVTAWNPSDLDRIVLPPCHYSFSCYARELTYEERQEWIFDNLGIGMEEYLGTDDEIPRYGLSLMHHQRSADFLLGVPFNITSYAILLHLIAKECNMVADELVMSFENTHLYLNHLEAAKEQLKRSSEFDLPTISIADKSISELKINDIEIHNYKSLGKIKAPLNN